MNEHTEGNGYSIVKLDGTTGQQVSVYADPAAILLDGPVFAVHTDGTIFAHQYTQQGGSVIAIDPTTGTPKFTVAMPHLSEGYHCVYGMIIGGGGYAYVLYEYVPQDFVGQSSWLQHLMLLQISSSGVYNDIDISDYTSSDILGTISDAHMITDSDQGVLLTWTVGNQYYMATTSGASVSRINAPQVPGQFGSVAPVLQAEDGSFIGTETFMDAISMPHFNMVAFDGSGSVRWTVPNEQPQIATNDGGVIGQSGIMYDSNGNATGQMNVFTQSWYGYAYQIGSVHQVLSDAINIAMGYASARGGNLSGIGDGFVSVLLNWFPPLSTGPNQAIQSAHSDLINLLRDPTKVAGGSACPAGSNGFCSLSDLAQAQVFDKIGADVNGNRLTTAGFVRYLQKGALFFDGTRSTFCKGALTSALEQYFCALPLYNDILGTVQAAFESSAGGQPPDALTQTPSTPQLTFFSPSYILTSSSGMNEGNEGTIFHEALHGYAGWYDLTLMGDGIVVGDYICGITTYIQNNILDFSRLKGTARQSCP